MSLLLLATRIICTIEGVVGATLNLAILSMTYSSNCSMSRLYKTGISIISIHGFTLCFLVGTMNCAHVFREGTFIAVAVSPLAQCIPESSGIWVARIFTAAVEMTCSLMSVPSAMQFISLSRAHWGDVKKLALSFMFPCLSFLCASTSLGELIPTPQFEEVMIRISREVYGMKGHLITFGSTMRYPELNNGRTLTYFAVFYAIIPYAQAYAALGVLVYKIRQRLKVSGMTISKKTMQMQRAFLVMQLLQTALPMAILCSPFILFVHAAFTQTDLGLGALWFTTCLCLCPSVQALVQLRYVLKTSSRKTPQASTIVRSTASVAVVKQ